MKTTMGYVLAAMSLLTLASCTSNPTLGDRLRAARKGVWLNTGGVYTVWTDDHYFVVSARGDSSSANIYCGASQIRFTDQGIARKQNVRVRQMGPGTPSFFTDFSAFRENSDSTVGEVPLQFDEGLFDPTTCVIKDGVIYDSIAEVTDEYILLATCNGDREKIYDDGRSAYLPASGGEFWSYRIEEIE